MTHPLLFQMTCATESPVVYPARFVSQVNVSVEIKPAAKADLQGRIVMLEAVGANVRKMSTPALMVYHVLTENVILVRPTSHIRS